MVSIYLAGEACGAITQILIGDSLGRIRFLQFLSIVATIGTAVQTASVNIGMFLFGRWAAGYAVGFVDFHSAPDPFSKTESSMRLRAHLQGVGWNRTYLSL